MKWLITGGAGFIGSNFIRYWLTQHPSDNIINLDKLTYAGNLANLKDIENYPRYQFIKGDVCDGSLLDDIVSSIDGVVNFAAETHVDRSIDCPHAFLNTDILGTYRILESIRKYNKRLIHISTDEVYGSIDTGSSNEQSALFPGNPYSASKGGADLLCLAYQKTYLINNIIVRSCNVYGPYQYPEKLIPLFITNLLENKKVPLYGDGLNIREWIYVTDFCRALETIIQKGTSGAIYNISTGDNLDICRLILKVLARGEEWIQKVPDRKGHDRRYSMNADKLRQLGWSPEYSLDKGLKATIDWYQNNPDWWQLIKSGEYKKYYQAHYGGDT
jgi:dTDP-glucose 4,6-dehydratase